MKQLESMGNFNKVEEMNLAMKRHLTKLTAGTPTTDKQISKGYKLINQHYNQQPKSSLLTLKVIPGPTNSAFVRKTQPVRATSDISLMDYGRSTFAGSRPSKQITVG
jgi:hypothetical protein